jgi:Glycosyl hydrolase family 26
MPHARRAFRRFSGLPALAAALAVAVVLTLSGCSGKPTAAGSPGSRSSAGTGVPTPAPASAAPMGALTGDTGAPAPTPGKTMLGTYLDLKGMSFPDALAKRNQQLGREPRIVQWYYEWTDTLPAKFPELPAGAIPMVTWRGTTYSSILNGSQDALIGKQADRLKAYGKPVFLRWAWEMNGSWYVWGGSRNGNDPAKFVQAWQHLHKIFLDHGATNVGWTWAPNWYSLPQAPWNTIDAYYPGDQYVDWVGISGYGDTGLTPDKIYNEFYNAYASRKPMMLAETGVIDRGGTTKPDWITALKNWTISHPDVGAVCWYDTNTSPGTTDDFRIDSSPGSLAAFKAMANDPYFSG